MQKFDNDEQMIDSTAEGGAEGLAEEEYIEENMNNGRLSVFCGSQGSGKTHLMLSFVKMGMKYNLYQTYIFISPTIDIEKDKQYTFLRKQRNVVLYDSWDDSILNKIKGKSIIVIDDATSIMLGQRFNPSFIKTATTLRHLNLTMFLGVHALKYILLPALRQNINFLFVGKYTNANMLTNIYEEFLSIFIETKQEFMHMYRESQKTLHNFLFVDCVKNGSDVYDFNVSNWEMLEYSDVDIKESGKASTFKPLSDDMKYRQQLKQKYHKKDIEKEFKPVKGFVFGPGRFR